MDKYKKLAMIMCSIGLIFLLTGATYAFFNYKKTGEDNVLITGDIYMHLNEGNEEISLTGIFPETKEEARARNDNYITFTIDGLNESRKDIYYEIDLIHGDDITGYTRFNDEHLVFDLIEIGTNNEETYLVNARSFDSITSQKIWVDTIDGSTTSEIEKTYKLRMWLSDNVIISDTDPNADYPATGKNAYKNHFASIKVRVIGDFTEKSLGSYYKLIENVDASTKPDFQYRGISSSTQMLVLAGTENDSFPIYYYRGAVTNNNVIFGGFCWQIVRTTDTGGIKMVYNGVTTGNGMTCENTAHADRIVSTSDFNSGNEVLSSLGYMSNKSYSTASKNYSDFIQFSDEIEYGDFDNDGTEEYRLVSEEDGPFTCQSQIFNTTFKNIQYTYSYFSSTSYIMYLSGGEDNYDAIYKTTGNGSDAVKLRTINQNYNLNVNDSTIKSELENWFRTNLTNEVNVENPNYVDYIEDTEYCNDRSFKNAEGYVSYPIVSSMAWHNLYFGTINRWDNNWYSSSNVPTFSCPNLTDQFRVNNNLAKLNYPVGLLTADEVVLAGATGNPHENTYTQNNSSFYLYTGGEYWTMSPHNNNASANAMFITNQNGGLNARGVNNSAGVRPVISLKLGVEFESSGDGTPTNPYVVKYS